MVGAMTYALVNRSYIRLHIVGNQHVFMVVLDLKLRKFAG